MSLSPSAAKPPLIEVKSESKAWLAELSQDSGHRSIYRNKFTEFFVQRICVLQVKTGNWGTVCVPVLTCFVAILCTVGPFQWKSVSIVNILSIGLLLAQKCFSTFPIHNNSTGSDSVRPFRYGWWLISTSALSHWYPGPWLVYSMQQYFT